MDIRHHQRDVSVNIWVCIFGDGVVGPYTLPQHLTDAAYLVFPKEVLPSLLLSVMTGPQHIFQPPSGISA